MQLAINNCELFIEVTSSQSSQALNAAPDIILLHGGFGMDHSYWLPLAKKLSKNARIIMPNLRGSLRSPCDDLNQVNLSQLTDDVIAICNHLEISHPIIIGTSLGANLTLALGQVSGFASHVVALGSMHFDMTSISSNFKEIGGETSANAAKDFYGYPSIEKLPLFMQFCMPCLEPDIGNYPILAEMGIKPETMLHSLNNIFPNCNLEQGTQQLSCPTLLIDGDKDPLSVNTLKTHLANHNQDIQHLVLNNCGHFSMLSQTELVSNAIRDFALR